MKGGESPQVNFTGKVPRLTENSFDIRKLSMREFETFMILLINDGVEQPILKNLIDQEFDYTSPTKGYDHINNLCKKKFAYKRKTTVKGKNLTKIYVKSAIRKKYEKYMLPTIGDLEQSLKDILKDYTEGIKEEEKVREKFKAYTETIILALNDLIKEAPAKSLNSQRFQKKMYDTIWKYFRSEILKYEVFSK
jgi:hypothetical protein